MCARPATTLCADQMTPHGVGEDWITSGEKIFGESGLYRLRQIASSGTGRTKQLNSSKSVAKTYGPFTEGGWITF